jgi:hypothetical protein
MHQNLHTIGPAVCEAISMVPGGPHRTPPPPEPVPYSINKFYETVCVHPCSFFL